VLSKYSFENPSELGEEYSMQLAQMGQGDCFCEYVRYAISL